MKDGTTIWPHHRSIADNLGKTDLSLKQVVEPTIHLQPLFDEFINLFSIGWIDSRRIQISQVSIECAAGKVNNLVHSKVPVTHTIVNDLVNKLGDVDGRKGYDHCNHHEADCDYQFGLQSHWTSQLPAGARE